MLIYGLFETLRVSATGRYPKVKKSKNKKDTKNTINK
jgi:hypothetical protein